MNKRRKVTIYYHDPVEVDPTCSWTGLCPELTSAIRLDVRQTSNSKAEDLFRYARPDAVITVDDEPIVSIEQTQMNPSGHNIPQRFSFHLAAAEFSIPSILYYPKFSRRTLSDPNVRYVQVRVPLAQKRLSRIYKVPVLSLFWPTDPETKLPTTVQAKHQFLADTVGSLIRNSGDKSKLIHLPEVRRALDDMDAAIVEYAEGYSQNPSVRALLPNGFISSRTSNGFTIDPPKTATFHKTSTFISGLNLDWTKGPWPAFKRKLESRNRTLVFKGTANHSKTDSEHPWPGYLTLFDALYARSDNGKSHQDRSMNLVYHLPVTPAPFLKRVNSPRQPTATHIVDVFSDLIILNGGVFPGKPLRGSSPATFLHG